MNPILLLALPLLGEGPLFHASDLKVGEEVVTLTCGTPAKDFILEVNGGGLIVNDFNMDGHLDLVTVNGSTIARVRAEQPSLSSELWLGDGQGNFARAGEEWALPGGVWGMGGCAGDVDADGDPDLFITEWGRNRLFLNNGGKGFIGTEDGIAGGDNDSMKPTGLKGKRWSTSSAFLDYDKDGHLDLVVVNYLAFHLAEAKGPGEGCSWKGHDVMCGPEGMVPVHDQLFKGNGDGTFEDVSLASGFRPDSACFGLGVMTLDYDRDGDTDIYITNDSMPNHLWENQGDGIFKEVGLRRGVSHDSNGKEQAGMGIACGDVDGDGRADLFVTNFSGERNSLYRSSRKSSFRERADVSRLGGPSIQRLGWGTGMWDYNLDGFVDLFVINGHVYPAANRPGTDTTYAQADQLFLGGAGGRFAEQALSDGPDWVGRAAVSADFDEDGDLDIVVVQVDGPVRYLRNDFVGGDQGHWLSLDLKAVRSHPDAIGAQVKLKVGERVLSSEVRNTAGYQAGCSTRLHFGLGAADKIDSIEIEWPSGHTQTVTGAAANQTLVIVEESK
jgi:enediyne biosynthesis protein E4